MCFAAIHNTLVAAARTACGLVACHHSAAFVRNHLMVALNHLAMVDPRLILHLEQEVLQWEKPLGNIGIGLALAFATHCNGPWVKCLPER